MDSRQTALPTIAVAPPPVETPLTPSRLLPRQSPIDRPSPHPVPVGARSKMRGKGAGSDRIRQPEDCLYHDQRQTRPHQPEWVGEWKELGTRALLYPKLGQQKW